MTIFLIANSLQVGGAEKVLSKLANGFSRRGVDVVVLVVNSYSGKDVVCFDKSVTVLENGDCNGNANLGRFLFLIKRMQWIRRLVKDADPDAVVSFMTHTNNLTLLSLFCSGAKIIVSERSDPIRETKTTLLQRFIRVLLYRFSFLVIAQRNDVGDWLAKRCKCRTKIIPNPIESGSALDLVRDKIILVVGRLSAEKRQAEIILVVARILRLQLGWRLVIVGDGPEREKLEKLAIQERCETLVQFEGFVQEPIKYYRKAALLIHNSSFEGFPNVIFEAMANGCPVVASRSSIVGLFEDIVPLQIFSSLDQLEVILSELINCPESLDVLRISAKQYVKKYHPDSVIDQWLKCFNSVQG
jgi:GalNAc-alpha-(1->4)-GalNAc-alpha-(1->3)-diNAcBac-PP-undecaprenol alpha-1,4-N-acetyl-D-galactosaminyltransferase